MEITQNLVRTFDTSLDQAGFDVQELIQWLTSLKLLRYARLRRNRRQSEIHK